MKVASLKLILTLTLTLTLGLNPKLTLTLTKTLTLTLSLNPNPIPKLGMLNGNRKTGNRFLNGTGLESEKPVVDFARVRTFTCVIGVGLPAGGARRGEGRSPAGPGAVPGR